MEAVNSKYSVNKLPFSSQLIESKQDLVRSKIKKTKTSRGSREDPVDDDMIEHLRQRI